MDLSFHNDDGKIFVFIDGGAASPEQLDGVVQVLNTDVMKRIITKSLEAGEQPK